MEHLRLSDGEWKLMKTLWARQGQTLAELVAALDADTGWSRATIFMMLKRLIAKGAVTMNDSGKFQKYSAAITYSDVEPEETESFLSKVYGGSVGMMVSNLVGRGALSEQEIQELKAIKGLEFNLELSDIVIPEKCPLLEVPFHFGTKECYDYSPSIDRIDNSKGYVKGNIQIISMKANAMKNSASLEELYTFCKNILRYSPNCTEQVQN